MSNGEKSGEMLSATNWSLRNEKAWSLRNVD